MLVALSTAGQNKSGGKKDQDPQHFVTKIHAPSARRVSHCDLVFGETLALTARLGPYIVPSFPSNYLSTLRLTGLVSLLVFLFPGNFS